MQFLSERVAVAHLSDIIVKSGVSLYNSIKYIYSLAEDDFYNCSVKDVLKIVLNNLTDIDGLQSMGLRIDNDKCREMNSPEYNKVLSLIVYSFAVRIPTLKNVMVNGKTMTDDQLKRIYNTVVSKGADNYKNAVSEDYDEIKRLIKQKKPIQPYSADWYKTYVLTHIPAIADITNKNIFLLGVVDILFTMFYSCLEEELSQIIYKQETV